jgi:hypothetical protein
MRREVESVMKKVVVCRVEGIDPPVLSRWRFYEVLEEETAPTRMIRVRADDGSARWFPASLFAPYPSEPPRLMRWQFDEPIDDVERDYVEVSLDLSDGTRRWCNVVTLGWLQRRLTDPSQCAGIHLEKTLVVPTLAPEHVEATLRDLEYYKQLTSATRPLPPDREAEEGVTE